MVGSHTPTLPKGHDCGRGSERSRSAGTSKVFPCVSSPSSPRRFAAKLHHKRLSMSCSIDPDPLKNHHHNVVEGFVCLLGAIDPVRLQPIRGPHMNHLKKRAPHPERGNWGPHLEPDLLRDKLLVPGPSPKNPQHGAGVGCNVCWVAGKARTRKVVTTFTSLGRSRTTARL